MECQIGVISGDGIGPEIVTEAKKVLDQIGKKYGHSFHYTDILMGGCSIDATGVPLTDDAIAAAKASDAVLMGSIGGNTSTSPWYKLAPELRPEAGLLKLRKSLNLFANLRPAYLYEELKAACPLRDDIIGTGFDMMIMRELTGGLYFGARKTEEVDGVTTATDTLTYNENEIRRIAKRGFDIAMKRRKKVTSVDKANVLDSSRLWRKIVEEVAKDYPEVTYEHMLVDNCAMQLVKDPKQFDVILTENMFGDILSDEASMVTGSIGMLSSASLNDTKFGLYEPSGGSAPDIAGKGIANPIATILSAAMMLRYSFDLDKEADAIENAVKKVLKAGFRTIDIMPQEEAKKAAEAKEAEAAEETAEDGKERKFFKKKKDKKGIFSVIKDIFFESIEDDLNEANVATGDGELLEKAVDNAITAKTNTVDDGKEQDENEKLIDEVFHGKANLDQPEAPKKGLIAKIKYRYQQFKIRQEKEGKLEEEQEQIENQQKAEAKEAKKAQAEEKKKQAAAKKEEKKKQAKQAKDKKPKKEKKPKKVKVKEPPKPGDILKIKPKSIILFILLIAGIIMLIQVFGYSINYNSKVNAAKDYFINGEYEKAYNSLSGMNLSGNEETIYNQSKVVMYVQRQYESYLNYRKMNMNTEAINALIKGVDRYQTYRAEGKELGVDDKMKESYDKIINALKDTYKISETEAISLADMSNSDFVTYYYKIEAYGEAVK